MIVVYAMISARFMNNEKNLASPWFFKYLKSNNIGGFIRIKKSTEALRPAILLKQADADSDEVGDVCDNCLQASNPAQIDTSRDGYGNACDFDYDNNGGVDQSDKALFEDAWQCTAGQGCYDPDIDSDSNGVIGMSDLTGFRGSWLGTPGPSGLSCAGTTPCP